VEREKYYKRLNKQTGNANKAKMDEKSKKQEK